MVATKDGKWTPLEEGRTCHQDDERTRLRIEQSELTRTVSGPG
ncbi:hypothetical protein QWZ16_03070 [Vibrio ostreicida]|uniref:Uncharacterized protein n=1 Tax=Vibrio ostreicida TaxID=526588 RepID=A0ABT8BQ13_9VIBR|nr:hypothetical protein [Vibrio ostreicida]MDN3608739.1 hypothetical protein [Vibrio ostreicida]